VIRVCVVDDHTLVRQGIRTLLGLVQGIEVVGEADGGRAALSLVSELRPDVLLLDLRMPDLDGVGVLRELRAAGLPPVPPPPPAIILTTFDDDALFLEAIRAGAKGFLLKDVSLERLAEAIRTVAAGGTLIQPAVTERILRAALDAGYAFPSLDPPDPLTDREIEVLRLITGGYNNREIAGTLQVAEGTVKNHISSILSKLGVRDRTRAVLKGLEMGLM
jgi:DNA-binding NarL/FixJ family response regulator